MNTKVSIVIVTYNSSRFIMETLDSTLRQTWNEIELIITDDCSSDNTLDLCRNWINENRERFVRVELLASEVNTGVSENANRGLHRATGEWIKFMAGDDSFEPGFIQKNMEHIQKNPHIRVLFSQVKVYRDQFQEQNFLKITPEAIARRHIFWPERTVESQYRMLLTHDRIHFTPSAFLHRETLLSVGGFDKRFRDQEDYALWLNLTRNGYKLHYMDGALVNYRMHANALNNTGIPYVVNPNFFKEEDFRKAYTYPYLPRVIRLKSLYIWYVSQIFRCKWLNKNRKMYLWLLYLLNYYLNPFQYYIFLKKQLNPELKENELYM